MKRTVLFIVLLSITGCKTMEAPSFKLSVESVPSIRNTVAIPSP